MTLAASGLSSTATSVDKGIYWTKIFTGLGAVSGGYDAFVKYSPFETRSLTFIRHVPNSVVRCASPYFLLSSSYFGAYVGMEKARGGLKSSMNAVVAAAALGGAYTVMYSDHKMGAFIAIVAGSWGWYKEFEDKIYGRP